MKKTLTILLLALVVGCVPADEPKTCDGAECTTENNVTPQNGPDVKGSFLSGHLGNYYDCPEEGYSKTSSDASRAAPGADFAPCEAADDSCGGPLNCDAAQLTIRLTNGGRAPATLLEVSKIEIYDTDGLSLAVLPVTGLFDISTNAAFDGTLAVGASVDLRVEYRGPANLSELMTADDGTRISSSEAAEIEITVSAENHRDIVIDGGEVFVLPSVVT